MDARLGEWKSGLDAAAGLVNLTGRSVDCIKTPNHQDEILRYGVSVQPAVECRNSIVGKTPHAVGHHYVSESCLHLRTRTPALSAQSGGTPSLPLSGVGSTVLQLRKVQHADGGQNLLRHRSQPQKIGVSICVVEIPAKLNAHSERIRMPYVMTRPGVGWSAPPGPDQLADGLSTWSTTSISTGPRVDSNLSPSWS